jgi:hypothetical protein
MSTAENRKPAHEDEAYEEINGAETPEQIEQDVQAETLTTEDPSWFARTYNRLTPEEMAERYQKNYDETMAQATFGTPTPAAYDAYKRRLEERFRMAQTMGDPSHAPLHANAGKAAAPLRPMRVPFAPRPPVKPEKSSGRVGMFAIATVTLLACGIGGAGGYSLANPGSMASVLSGPGTVLSGLYTKFIGSGSGDDQQTLLNKSTLSARIDVNDVSGPVNGPIPLSIAAFPINSDTPISIKISGLPPDAYLTRGVHVAEGAWLLKTAELAKAELVVPKSASANLGLEVAALDDKTGLEAAPPQQMKVALDLNAVPLPGAVPPPEQFTQQDVGLPVDVRVEPVSAEPDQGFNRIASGDTPTVVPVPLQTINSETVALISKGRMLLKGGDLIAARQFFLKAHAQKVPEAAFYVGQTYDPATFNALRVVGLQPDAQLAAEWYGKAAAQGVAAANEALTKLSAR